MGVVDLKSREAAGDDGELVVPNLKLVDCSIFNEIANLLEEKFNFVRSEEDDKVKFDKLKNDIESAEAIIKKAEKKREALLARKERLNSNIVSQEERANEAAKYWKDFGLEVRQISKEEDPYEEYEFIFNSLSSKMSKSQPEREDSQTPISFNIRLSDRKKLEIVSHDPEIFDSDSLTQLNTRLTANCIDIENDSVDYRLAMLLIKKEVKKTLASRPKTF